MLDSYEYDSTLHQSLRILTIFVVTKMVMTKWVIQNETKTRKVLRIFN